MESFYFQETAGRQWFVYVVYFVHSCGKNRQRRVRRSLDGSDLQLHSISSSTSHTGHRMVDLSGTNLQPITLLSGAQRKMHLHWVKSSRWWATCVSSASCYISSSADSTGENRQMETHRLSETTHTHTLHSTSCTLWISTQRSVPKQRSFWKHRSLMAAKVKLLFNSEGWSILCK